jgi:hypothetical protein
MLEATLTKVLQAVFGGGSNPGSKTATTVLDEASIAAGATTAIGDCDDIDLSGGASALALTVEATYNGAATQGIKVHVRTSYDGTNWDTEDWDSWNARFTAGDSIRQTKNYDTDPMYLRVLIENLDPAQAVTGVKVISAVGA